MPTVRKTFLLETLMIMNSVNQSPPKNSRNFIFGAIFIGFLLNCAAFIFSSIFGWNEVYSNPWLTYIIISVVAGIIWMRDGVSKNDPSFINGFADGLGFKREGHGPLVIGIGLILIILGILAKLGDFISVITKLI